MSSPTGRSQHIVVIGAGVVGLQSALHIQRAGYTTTIIAEHVPGDESPLYSSPWAGAQWRTHADAGDEVQQRWDSETYRDWMDLVERGQGTEAGLGIVPAIQYWSSPPSSVLPEQWYHSLVQDFRVLSSNFLPPGVLTGVTYNAPCVNVPRYLPYLLSVFLSRGGRLIKHGLPTNQGLIVAVNATVQKIEDAGLGAPDVFVNATGLGAKALVPDENVYPVKGQTVLVKGEATTATTTDDGKYYVIPRPGSETTILGGTREVGVWSTDIDKEVTSKILERCKVLVPELLDRNGAFEVLSVQCGLRPARKGGVRVERQILSDGHKVIHAYGHAGAGYQNSVGAGRQVAELLDGFGEDPD